MSASAGRVLAINRGDYNSATAYTPMDKVYYLGSTYICIADSTGNLPTNTTYWQIEAKGVSDASDLDYDNTVSGLTADDVQEAVDELASEKQDNLTFDASPTENSTNPVTSGGVYTALGNKQDTLTFDNIPTENSTNPVKSGGVYSAIEDVQDYAEDNISAIVNVYGSKQMIPYPYTETTKTESGITFTDVGDGTIIIETGTASADAYFAVRDGDMSLKKGDYILNGCPEGGSESTYCLYFNKDGITYDVGDEADLSFDSNFSNGQIVIRIKQGTVISSPITFKPMVRVAGVTDPTHVLYAKTNKELTDESKRTYIGYISSAISGSSFDEFAVNFATFIKTQVPINGMFNIVIDWSGNLTFLINGIRPKANQVIFTCFSYATNTYNYCVTVIDNTAYKALI